MVKRKKSKKLVYYIASQLKGKPIRIEYFTYSGESVDSEKVVRKENQEGVRYYTYL